MSLETTYKYMNIQEAAAYTGYKIGTIYRMTSSESIPFMGGRGCKLEFDPMELDLWRSLDRTKDAARAIMSERQERVAKKIGLKLRKRGL